MSKIKSVFSEKIPFPKFLADFEQWAEQFEEGELGYCKFSVDYLDDNWIENGNQLADQFALWLHMADGSNIGFWRPKHFTDNDILPIVFIGSEGELEVLGDSLEDFLYKWAEGATTFENGYELQVEETTEIDYRHEQMLDWLKENNVQKPPVSNPITTEDLQGFFKQWQEENVPKK